MAGADAAFGVPSGLSSHYQKTTSCPAVARSRTPARRPSWFVCTPRAFFARSEQESSRVPFPLPLLSIMPSTSCLLLLALMTPGVSAKACENWCSRWTCNNENYCGGCDASVCEGPTPHRMCSDEAQRYCGAPRCEKWCAQLDVDACARPECGGCRSCRSYKPSVDLLRASPFPAPEVVEEPGAATRKGATCDHKPLTSIASELRALVDAQMSRNSQLQAAHGGPILSPPPAASTASVTASPPPPCVPLGAQCGGRTWNGATTCCASATTGTQTFCRWMSDAFSGCREVTEH